MRGYSNSPVWSGTCLSLYYRLPLLLRSYLFLFLSHMVKKLYHMCSHRLYRLWIVAYRNKIEFRKFHSLLFGCHLKTIFTRVHNILPCFLDNSKIQLKADSFAAITILHCVLWIHLFCYDNLDLLVWHQL